MKEKVTATEEMIEEVVEVTMLTPTDEKLQEWENLYKKVFRSELTEEDTFYFRPLTRREFKELANVEMDQLSKEESLCEICVLWPENYNAAAIDEGLAGAPTILAEQIMRESGFNPNSVPILL